MTDRIRRRFYLEAIVALLAAALAVLTVVCRDWIEKLVGVDPDGGSGSVEWAIVVALLVAALLAGTAARLEWQQRVAAVRSR